MQSDRRLDERTLSKGEVRSAALVANRAFFNDPFFRFLSPGDRFRARGLTIFSAPISRTSVRALGS